jgi:hypothetical protein
LENRRRESLSRSRSPLSLSLDQTLLNSPGMSFIVFPGNVGHNETLCRVAERLGVERKVSVAASEVISTLSAKQIQTLRASNRTFQLLQRVKSQHSTHAIAAFNVYNLEGAKAAVDAANELQTPVILQVCPFVDLSLLLIVV